MSSAASEKTTVTILGSGSCVPSLTRSSCSILVSATGTGPAVEPGENLLFDCGAGTTLRLLAAGQTPDTISRIFLSHFHPDHAAELVYLLFAARYADPAAPRRHVTVVGGRGLHRFSGGLARAFGDWLTRKDGQFDFAEVAPETREPLATRCFEVCWGGVSHKPESLAYRVRSTSGRTLVYSGDTEFSRDLVVLARNADLFICEASFPDGQEQKGHMTPSVAGRTARLAGVRRLVLTHLNPACDQVDLEAQCRREFDGDLVIASDLMRLEI